MTLHPQRRKDIQALVVPRFADNPATKPGYGELRKALADLVAAYHQLEDVIATKDAQLIQLRDAIADFTDAVARVRPQ